MANRKSTQPRIDWRSLSNQDYQHLLAGGNLDKPLYEFDEDGDVIYHQENLQNFQPNVLFKNPFTGNTETASKILDYVKNEEDHRNAVGQIYDNLSQYNRSYKVNSKANQFIKSLGTFATEAVFTGAEVVSNIANAGHSVGRTTLEEFWNIRRDHASKAAKDEMMSVLNQFGSEQEAFAYVKGHDFEKDLTISDEAKGLFKDYKNLLEARDSDNLWSRVISETFAGARENSDKIFNREYGANKYQNISKFASLGGNVVGSLGMFKAAGIGARIATKSTKIGAALTKATGITGESAAVYGMSFFNQYDSLRRQGLAAGMSYEEANNMAFVGAVWESFVEGKGMSRFGRLQVKKSIMNVINKDVLPEALEEMAQTLGENVVTKVYGINEKKIRDIAEEIVISGLGGAFGGAFVGTADYALGQYATRIAAANELRQQAEQEALNKAKENNKQLLLEYHQKQVESKEKAQAAAISAQTQETSQLEAEMPQQIGIENEQRFLLERDENYAQEMAQIEENYRNSLRPILEEKLKKVNPKITDEQLENAVALLFRVSEKLERNDSFGAAIDSWAEDIVKWTNESAPQYEGNLAILDQKFGMASLGLSPEDINDLKSNNRFKRHKSQWKFVNASLQTELKRAGASKETAKKLADTFERTFANTAILSNVDPLVLSRRLSPRIIGLTRASMNGQTIEGYTGVLDNLADSRKVTPVEQRIEAENLIDSLSNKSDNDEAKNQKEVSMSEIYRGVESRQNITPEEFMEALDNRADKEHALADDMGISQGNDFTQKDYQTMALMRARGASQSAINDAFRIEERVDPESEYEKSLQKLYPELTPEEVKEAERILARINKEKPKSKVKGAFEPDSKDYIAYQNAQEAGEKETVNQEPANVGGTVLTSDEASDSVIAEEFTHSITTKLEEAAKIQAVKDSGKQFIAAYDIYSLGMLPEVRPLARLFTELTAPINGVEMTDKQKHETIATAFTNFVKLEVMPRSQREALNENEAEKNDVIATAEDSKYNELSEEQKKALGDRFTNLLKNEASPELIAIGNALTSLTKGYDVLAAKKLALDTLNKYRVYNDSQWAYLLSQLENMSPSEQLSVLDSFGLNLVQQGYDLLVADTYDLESTPEGKQVLVKKAYKEGSFFAEDTPTEIYYHSQSTDNKAIRLLEKSKNFWKDATSWFKDTFDFGKFAQNYIQTLSNAAFKADPVIGSVLRHNMYLYSGEMIECMKIASEIPQLAEKHKLPWATGENEREFISKFKNMLFAGNKNSREKAKQWISKQFSATGEEQQVAETMQKIYDKLDSIHNELRKLGVPVGFVKEYWPRYVTDRDGLANYLGRPEPLSPTDKMIRSLVQKLKKQYKNKTMEELRTEAINIINRQWHKYQDGEDVTAFHNRGMTYRPDMEAFYDDPFKSLARYFENANRTILMRRLTGRVLPSAEETNGEYVSDFDKAVVLYKNKGTKAKFTSGEAGQLGKAFALALTNPNPNSKALDNFAKKMKQFVNRTDIDEANFIRFWKRTNAMLLGNYISTLNQFNELPIILKNYGLTVTNDALSAAIEEMLEDFEKQGTNLESVNIQPLQDLLRYKDDDMLAKITDISHTISGFKYADVLLKNVEIKAALLGAQDALLNPNVDPIRKARFWRDFDLTFPKKIYTSKEDNPFNATREEVLNDIKEGKVTEPVKFYLFNCLSNIQPINAAEVPGGYNSAGSIGRLLYQYRTTPLRQLENQADDIIWGFKNLPLKDALKNLMYYFAYFMAIGVPITVLQNLLRGRKTDLIEASLYSPMQLMMVNEYTISSIEQKGLFSGLVSEMGPSFRVGDAFTKDAIRMVEMKDYQGNVIKVVPVAGPIVWSWFGPGRDYAKRHDEALFSGDKDEQYSKYLKRIGGK